MSLKQIFCRSGYGIFLFCSLLLWSHVQAQTQTKIVTLSPVVAEWVSEILGKEEAEKEMVGVSEYSNYPQYLERVPTVGPYPQIQEEKVLRLKPTLVIASSEYNRVEQIEKLKKLKLNIVILPKEKFNEMEPWIKLLGDALHQPEKAKVAIEKWKNGIRIIDTKMSMAKIQNKRAFIQVQDNPIIAVGGDGFLNDAFEKIGYQNIYKDLKQAYPKISRESVLKENPDYIFILDLVQKEDEFKKSKQKWENYKELQAVQNGAIKMISGNDFARCTLRLLKALQQII